jgi:hypothetical protein
MEKQQMFRRFVILSCMLCACGPTDSSTAEETDTLDQTRLDELTEIIETPIAEDVPLFKLKEAQSEFDETLLNSIDQVDGYLQGEDKAALNMGVYATDALYLAIYDKTSEYIMFSNVCQRIGSEIGVRDGFSGAVAQRLDANAGNADSICRILTSAIRTARSTLEEDGQDRIAAMIAIGSFAENLFLLCTSIRNHPNAQGPQDGRFTTLIPTVRATLKQRASLKPILERLARLEKDESVNWLNDNLILLDSEMEAINSDKILPNDGINGKTLDKICPRVAKIREYIVR